MHGKPARLLPSVGPYAAWITFADGRSFNAFASTIDELWRVLDRYDRRAAAVYHACARFKEAKHDPRDIPIGARKLGRTNHNVAELKSLFLDIDAGPSERGKPAKPYRNGREAAGAVLDFCQISKMPIPLFVASGNGLHVYWPLTRPLAPEEWQSYARGLKRLCDKFRLRADPSRTGTHYELIDNDSMRATVYAFLDASDAPAKNGTTIAFKPNSKCVSEVIDALRGAANVSGRLQSPCWLRVEHPSIPQMSFPARTASYTSEIEAF
jgi:hypothetical protein